MPATTKATPTSWTKCRLKGPVSGTPGTLSHQAELANSMTSPLAPLNTARIAAIHRCMVTSCAPDERRGPGVTGEPENFWLPSVPETGLNFALGKTEESG